MAKIILSVVRPERYFRTVISILRSKTRNKKVIYVTTNKPYNHIVNELKKAKIQHSKFFFIDCISQYVGIKKGEEKNCLYVESPSNLTAIGVAIDTSTRNISGKPILIIDSLSTLLIHNSANMIGKFSNFIINKMRSSNVDTVILLLESDMDKEIIKQVESVADEMKKYGS